MALHSAEFPLLIPALEVPWQNCFQMSISIVQFGHIAGSSSLGNMESRPGTETRSASGKFRSSERKNESIFGPMIECY
jgi:hypothetical protein